MNFASKHQSWLREPIPRDEDYAEELSRQREDECKDRDLERDYDDQTSRTNPE